jgi:tRNA G10  N-methylase Trm11
VKKLTFENENKKREEITPATNNVNTRITKTSLHRYQINSNSLITITISPEYSSLVHPLSDFEYNTLKNSIMEDGLHYPIIINSKGEILDGHHRYQICKELGIITQLKHEVKYFKISLEEKQFVIDINLKRRQLSNFQKIELGIELEKIESQKAKLRQIELAGTRPNTTTLGPIGHKVDEKQGRTREIITKKVGVSEGSYERGKIIIQHGTQEQKERLRNGNSTINKEYTKIKKEHKRQELIKSINPNIKLYSEENCKLFCNDFTKIDSTTILDNSIDLIFTDPPYGKEFLYLYEELAKLATRVLKPGGSLVFLTGHIILNEVFKTLDSSNLKYWWILAVKHNGAKQRVHPRSVFAEWKPLLWYVKEEKSNILDTMFDHIESSPPDKSRHEWAQSPEEVRHLVRYLTVENQIVLDPMMGTGTTGIAALNLKRKFIGIEINQATFEIARSNIGNITIENKGGD